MPPGLGAAADQAEACMARWLSVNGGRSATSKPLPASGAGQGRAKSLPAEAAIEQLRIQERDPLTD